jgi:excisionase family DNA binding protein
MRETTTPSVSIRPSGDRALTVAEACECLGLKKTALYCLIQSSEIPHERYGRRIVLRQSDLDAYRAEHRVHSRARPH